MSIKYIEIELTNDEKEAILNHSGFIITSDITKKDLSDKRSKWIRFNSTSLPDIIGELSYKCNRSRNDNEVFFLNDLASHLENHL